MESGRLPRARFMISLTHSRKAFAPKRWRAFCALTPLGPVLGHWTLLQLQAQKAEQPRTRLSPSRSLFEDKTGGSVAYVYRPSQRCKKSASSFSGLVLMELGKGWLCFRVPAQLTQCLFLLWCCMMYITLQLSRQWRHTFLWSGSRRKELFLLKVWWTPTIKPTDGLVQEDLLLGLRLVGAQIPWQDFFALVVICQSNWPSLICTCVCTCGLTCMFSWIETYMYVWNATMLYLAFGRVLASSPSVLLVYFCLYFASVLVSMWHCLGRWKGQMKRWKWVLRRKRRKEERIRGRKKVVKKNWWKGWRGCGEEGEEEEEGKRGDDPEYFSNMADHYLERLRNKKNRMEWRRWKKMCLCVPWMFMHHVNVITTSIHVDMFKCFFWEALQTYSYINLIAIMTWFLIVLVEPEFLPVYILSDLVLEICTFEIVVHVVELILWRAHQNMNYTYIYIYIYSCTCTWGFQLHQLDKHVWRTCSLLF